MTDSLSASAIDFLRDYQSLAEPIVFALAFAEGLPIVSLVVPSSALFLAIGSMHGAFGGSFLWLWAAATCGAILSDCATYAFGRRFKHEARSTWPFSRNPGWIARGQALLDSWGTLAVLGGKFVGPLRAVIPLTAGILDMPLPVFLPASFISSVAWSGAFLAPGWGVGLLFR